ncbi:MAG: hypothetical protein JSS04_11625 [Proteobacteria bacterium]|nr:hypothetical protein [Pseudomonadota bacterium]
MTALGPNGHATIGLARVKLTPNMLEHSPVLEGTGMRIDRWRLNGWVRIGIVLSVLWMVGGTGYLWQTTDENELSVARALSNRRSNCIADNAVLRMENKPEVPCTSQEEVSEAFARGHAGFGHSLMIAGVVLVLAWLVASLIWVTTRWVMEGFRPGH